MFNTLKKITTDLLKIMAVILIGILLYLAYAYLTNNFL